MEFKMKKVFKFNNLVLSLYTQHLSRKCSVVDKEYSEFYESVDKKVNTHICTLEMIGLSNTVKVGDEKKSKIKI